jgi:5-formyltetrahydrofolate cyclo-ligase
MDKTSVRKKVRIVRDSMPKELILRKSARIASKFKNELYPAIPPAKCAMVYLSTQSEVKTSGLINFLLSAGITLYVPCLENGSIIPVRYTRGCSLKKGAFKIKEPAKKLRASTPKCIGLVLVPGIAFDKNGHRIGFGKGFYDKFLKKLPKKAVKVGIAFDNQLVASITHEPHDVHMDYILTEKDIIHAG